jgi:hypothetical protein
MTISVCSTRQAGAAIDKRKEVGVEGDIGEGKHRTLTLDTFF